MKWLLHHDNPLSQTAFFNREFFRKKHDYSPPPTLLLFASPFEVKTERCPLCTIEVMEAVSHAVLKTLTEHDVQDEFKHGRSAGKDAYTRKGATSRMMMASRIKVSFDHMSAQIPEIMDSSL
jgi:hypothetical protein